MLLVKIKSRAGASRPRGRTQMAIPTPCPMAARLHSACGRQAVPMLFSWHEHINRSIAEGERQEVERRHGRSYGPL